MRLFFSHKKRPVWLFEGRPLFNKGYNFKYWDLSALLSSTLSAWHRILWGSLSFLLRLSWTQPLNFSTGFSLWGPMAGSGGGGVDLPIVGTSLYLRVGFVKSGSSQTCQTSVPRHPPPPGADARQLLHVAYRGWVTYWNHTLQHSQKT